MHFLYSRGRIGSLLPAPSNEPRFAQLWIVDAEVALEQRVKYMTGANRQTLKNLQDMLSRVNELANNLKDGVQMLLDSGEELPYAQSVGLKGIVVGNDRHRFNTATSHEVAAITSGDGDAPIGPRDLVASLHDGRALLCE